MFFRRETLNDRWIRTMPVVAASVAIYWISSLPDAQPPDLGFDWQDKVFHALAYGVYGMATLLAVWSWSASRSTRTILVVGSIAATLFALSDEWHQTFVPGRHGTLDDVLADIVGIALSALLFRLLLLRRF